MASSHLTFSVTGRIVKVGKAGVEFKKLLVAGWEDLFPLLA